MGLSGILDFVHYNLMAPTLPDFSSISVVPEDGLITPDNIIPVATLIFGSKFKVYSDMVGFK